MNSYELTFLVSEPQLAEKLKKTITSLKAKISQEKHWGKQALAYPIKKQTAADYYTWQLEIDSKDMPELKQKLTYDESILRFLLLGKGELEVK